MAGVAALAGFVAIGGLMMGGMALLGDLGDRLGPGYRDLFQGVAGWHCWASGRNSPVVVRQR